jgi:hypothetical protein
VKKGRLTEKSHGKKEEKRQPKNNRLMKLNLMIQM